MNEFDQNQINDRRPTPEGDPTPDEQPIDATAASTPDEQPTDSAPVEGSYAYTRDQLTDATTQFSGAGSWQQSADSASTDHAESGEYEVSFDSASGKYTYTDHSQPSAPPKNARRSHHGLVTLGLCATILVSSALGMLGGVVASSYWLKQSEQNGGNLHNTVQQETVVKVNKGEVNYGAIADAAAECYDSVVQIKTYASETDQQTGNGGSGSGVIWTEDGYIVTCNHVIAGANIINVILTDGTVYYADLVGADAETDLAVLKIQAGKLLPVTARGSELVLGETAIAIGTPLGLLTNTVSDGILSSLDREITIEGQTMSLVQTTAAVNSGNSGGGLFDINGSLIGIVNAKSVGDSVEGLGYAIPIETVIDISTQLIEQGFVTGRPQLGITVVTIDQYNYQSVFSDPDYADLEEYATRPSYGPWGNIVYGTYIVDASKVVGYADGSDSLKFGDQLLYVGSTEINSSSDVKAALNGYSAGDTIELTVMREQRQTIIIKLVIGQLGES